MNQKALSEKFPILIVGMGKSGQSAAKLLEKFGAKKGQDFYSLDDKKGLADFSESVDALKGSKAKTLLVSPGVPLAQDWIQAFKNDPSHHLLSELDLAAMALESEKLIGITGSVGKSSCVSMIGWGLDKSSILNFIGGNLGVTLSDYALDVLNGKRTRAQWICLELSSFQLENLALPFEIAAVTNLHPNHLDRYSSLEDYYLAKWNLFSLVKKAVVIASPGGDLEKFSKIHPQGLAMPILGKSNETVEVAKQILELVGADPGKLNFDEFPGLEHRLEKIESKGPTCINDSKSTTIEGIRFAVGFCHRNYPDRKVHLLIGGKDKNLPWEKLIELGELSNYEFYCFGELSDKLSVLLKEKFQIKASCSKLKEALSSIQAKDDDVILFSPGGSSHDEFSNFEERGEFFKSFVRENFK